MSGRLDGIGGRKHGNTCTFNLYMPFVDRRVGHSLLGDRKGARPESGRSQLKAVGEDGARELHVVEAHIIACRDVPGSNDEIAHAAHGFGEGPRGAARHQFPACRLGPLQSRGAASGRSPGPGPRSLPRFQLYKVSQSLESASRPSYHGVRETEPPSHSPPLSTSPRATPSLLLLPKLRTTVNIELPSLRSMEWALPGGGLPSASH